MGIFNKIRATFEEYIIFNSEAKQLTLKKKTVLLLCEQAQSRVEQLKSLQPDVEEGFIAIMENNKVKVQLHFTPEKITLHEDTFEGTLRLLKPPSFYTDSLVYRYLIAGWNTFLGGKIPNGALPKGVRLENNIVYYTLPRNQSQLVDALFHNLKNGSALITNVKQGDLIIETSASLNWNDFKLQNLLQLVKFQK
ncbi:hypothetical protein NIES2101_14920 [Calothrix sp. HK-06]|nr:hypothetical protein NIES2101_14920 [Calothrix sp. HK-06]